MDSTKETPSSSSSLQPSGSFLIRAPLTVDSDSEYDPNGLETASTIGGGSSFNSFENNSELGLSEEGEGFLSGNDDFDTVSERGISFEQDENNNNGGFSESYKLSNQVVVPIARMSIDDYEAFDEISSDEEILTEVEDEGFSGVVKVPPGSIEISTLDEGVRPPADESIAPENSGEERVESKNIEKIGSVDEVVVSDRKESNDVEKMGEDRVELEHGIGDRVEENGSVMFNDPNHDVQPMVESVDEVGVFDMKELSDVEKSGEERVESKNVEEIASVDEVVLSDRKESNDVEKMGEERVELEHGIGHRVEENGSVMFNDPTHDVQPVVESVDEVGVFDMKELSDVEKSDEERVESKNVEEIASVDEVVLSDRKESNDVEKMGEERVELEHGIGHRVEENGSVMFNDPTHDVQPVVESVDEVGVFDMKELSDVEKSGEERVESKNVEEIASVDEVVLSDRKESNDVEKMGEERVELEHGIGHRVEENGSVMFNDPTHDVQAVVESVDEVGVFDMKELSDVEKSGEERVESKNVEEIASVDEVVLSDRKESNDVEKMGEERVELEHGIGHRVEENGSVMFNDPTHDVQPVVESVDEVGVFDMKELSDVEKSGEERVESKNVEEIASVDEVVLSDRKESNDVEKMGEERVELEHGIGHRVEENGSVMFNDPTHDVQPVVDSVDEVGVFDMKELSDVEKSGEERVELKNIAEIASVDEVVVSDRKESNDVEKMGEERVEMEHGNDHQVEENDSVMFNDPNHDVQSVVESVDEVAVFDMKELSAVEKSGKERVASKDGNGHEIEENGSVMFSDSSRDVQPVVESVDKVVVFDMNEPNDVDSVEVSAPTSILDQNVNAVVEDIAEHDDDVVQLIFGTQQVVNEVDLEDRLEAASQRIVVGSDEEVEAEREYEAKELLDSAALAALLEAAEGDEEMEAEREYEAKELLDSSALDALLKAAAGAGSDSVGSRVFDLDRTAHSGSSLHSSKVAPLSNTVDKASKGNISDEDRQRFEKLQLIRVKFLRLVQRLGHSHTDPMVAQVLYRLALAAGSLFSQEFSLESAKRVAVQLEAEGKDDLDFSLNIVVLGKTGVGKSASINSILCEQKSKIDAFEPATTAMKEIVGTVDGVKMRIFDTPGLRSPVTEEATNRKLLASMKRFIKKFPPDLVLYVDRLDAHDKDLTDCILLKSLTDSLGSSIWKNAIVTLTHAASASPEGPFAEPLSFEVFVAQRSHVIHRAISQAVGDLRLMNPSMMHPVALVENHPSCERNGKGEILLPNGQTWRSQLLLLCYSVKILSEASSLSRPREHFDNQKLFGFRTHSPPLPYLLSTLLQSRPHPKLPNSEGGEDVDLDTELGDLTYSDEEDHDEYDQLPPFKPLKRSQVDKLSKQQRTAYYEEYDYRIKLLQKKQWREKVKRMRGIKKKGKDADSNNSGYVGDDGNMEEADPATIPVPLPDMVLPPSFDGENPTYRYRFLDSASQLLIRPVLDSQSWDHDIGYDGVSLERSLAIAGYFPGAFAVQITKDKKEFNIHLDSSVCAKHGENGSTMVGFDIQTIGKQLAHVFRGETKFRNFEINQTTAGLSFTFLGENVASGVKVEDQIAVGKRLVLAGSAGAMRSQGDTAYGANIEVRLKDKDFPVEQNQTTFGLSLVKWRRDLGLMANLQSQFSIGRSSSMAVRVGLNNKRSGQISVKTSSSDQLHIALFSFIPIAASIFRMVYPGSDLGSSAY